MRAVYASLLAIPLFVPFGEVHARQAPPMSLIPQVEKTQGACKEKCLEFCSTLPHGERMTGCLVECRTRAPCERRR